MGSTRPNPTHVRLGWVEFFLTYHGGLGQKIPSTRPMHTPISHTYKSTILLPKKVVIKNTQLFILLLQLSDPLWIICLSN